MLITEALQTSVTCLNLAHIMQLHLKCISSYSKRIHQSLCTLYVTAENTCKVSLGGSSGTKLCHQLPIWLEDEDTAGFVIYSNYMSIFIHSHSFGSHQPPGTNFILSKRWFGHSACIVQKEKYCWRTPLTLNFPSEEKMLIHLLS